MVPNRAKHLICEHVKLNILFPYVEICTCQRKRFVNASTCKLLFDGFRTCVNGQVVTDRTQLRHGDRILWGNNHFFRINCPHLPPPGEKIITK